MKKTLLASLTCCFPLFIFSHAVLASSDNDGLYVAANAGIFQGNFNQKYIDQTDVILQNIQQTIQQNGYTAGVALGYSKLFMQQYVVGAELSGNWDTNLSTYQAGASTAAFSDTTQIKNHFDLTFVPGMLLTESLEGYLKLGLSCATLRDNLTSPTGYAPTSMNYATQKSIIGFASGLGLKKFINKNVSLFVEGNYHDYGIVNLPTFQNFTATYTHNVHVYASTVTAGMAYHF